MTTTTRSARVIVALLTSTVALACVGPEGDMRTNDLRDLELSEARRHELHRPARQLLPLHR